MDDVNKFCDFIISPSLVIEAFSIFATVVMCCVLEETFSGELVGSIQYISLFYFICSPFCSSQSHSSADISLFK